MEELRQKEKQEWTDRNSTGRSPDFLPPPPPPPPPLEIITAGTWRGLTSNTVGILLRWPGNFKPGISFRPVVLQGHNHIFTKVEANGFDLTWSSYSDAFDATKAETSVPSKPVSKLYNSPFYLSLWSLWIQNHLWTSQSPHPKSEMQTGWLTEKAMTTHIIWIISCKNRPTANQDNSSKRTSFLQTTSCHN